MNSRIEALIEKGYDKELVFRLSSFTEEELKVASRSAFEYISCNCNPMDNPSAIFIGGQPGCGKTVMSMNLKKELKNILEIGIDNYRMYHPRYLEIEKCIREFWEGKKENINDTPGNDIANFTHYFAGDMTDMLIEMGKNKKYNMIIEWGMREPSEPLKCMEELKEKGYTNIVFFVSTNKELSYNACNMRYNIMKECNHIIRKVPRSFHDLCIETLPDSIDEIYKVGVKNKLIDYMAIVKRDNEITWNSDSEGFPGDIFKAGLNKINDDENDIEVAHKITKKEMIGLKNKI